MKQLGQHVKSACIDDVRNDERRAWDQNELARMHNAKFTRQPRDESIIFTGQRYLGVKTMRYNSKAGLYQAHAWLVQAWTQYGVRIQDSFTMVLDIPVARWNRAMEKFDLGMKPEELVNIYRLDADASCEITYFDEILVIPKLNSERGHLDEDLLDTAVIIEDE